MYIKLYVTEEEKAQLEKIAMQPVNLLTTLHRRYLQMRSQDLMHPVREIRTPQGTGKICELYHNGSEYFVLVKIRRKVYTLDICDSETDMVLDVAGGTIDSGFTESEWMVYGEQTFSDKSALLVIQHLLDTGSTTFTSEDLKRIGISRYTAKKIIDKLRDDFTR